MPKPTDPAAIRATRICLLVVAALLGLSETVVPLAAQTQPAFNRNVIVLDPAHGGSETGARLSDTLSEKQFTLAFAGRLKPLLTAAGFTVLTTRDAAPTDTLSPDQRASTANHARALACIIIHATPSGSGVHLFTSTLPSTRPDTIQATDPSAAIPWDSAQSGFLPLSLRLANELGVALLHANIPPLLGRASVRPIDNLTCPAIALELAPLLNPASDPTPVFDTAYQQHAAQAIADALASWRNRAAPAAPRPSPIRSAPPAPAAPPATSPAPASGGPR